MVTRPLGSSVHRPELLLEHLQGGHGAGRHPESLSGAEMRVRGPSGGWGPQVLDRLRVSSTCVIPAVGVSVRSDRPAVCPSTREREFRSFPRM